MKHLTLLLTLLSTQALAEDWKIPLPRTKPPIGYVQYAYAAKNDIGQRIEVKKVIKLETYEKIEELLKTDKGVE